MTLTEPPGRETSSPLASRPPTRSSDCCQRAIAAEPARDFASAASSLIFVGGDEVSFLRARDCYGGRSYLVDGHRLIIVSCLLYIVYIPVYFYVRTCIPYIISIKTTYFNINVCSSFKAGGTERERERVRRPSSFPPYLITSPRTVATWSTCRQSVNRLLYDTTP